MIAAAKQGHSLAIWTLERLGGEWGVEAQTAMGQHYLNCGDPQTALTWFKSAYPQNNSEPYFQIGYCYLKGVNVPQDLAQAKVYFEAASARGDNRAAIILGGLDSSERVPDSDDSELGSVASSMPGSPASPVVPAGYGQMPMLHFSAASNDFGATDDTQTEQFHTFAPEGP